MELWTPEHTKTLLPSIVVMLVISAVLRLTIGKKDLKIRMIPFQILACVIFLLEVGKQWVSYSRGYDLYHLPFHFCSLFIFMLPIMAFYKGKHRGTVTAITAAISGAMFLLTAIYPNLIYSAGNIQNYFTGYMDFHTVTFHNVVMLEFLLILALDLHTPASKGEMKAQIWFVLGFCAVSASMAHLLKTNYANFYTCNIAPLEEVRLSIQGVLGVVPTQILYVLILCVLNVLFVLMSYGFYRLVRGLLTKKKAAEVSIS